MRPFTFCTIFAIMWLVAACEEPDPGAGGASYPVSGAPCSPDDPVHDLGHSNCMPPG
jgi:hypothetical protein